MGINQSQVWTTDELDEYRFLTNLTIKEILVIFQQFRNLAPDIVDDDKNARLPMKLIFKFPGLNLNPMRDRMCHAFSTAQPNNGDMNFEDILDMMSVFHANAPLALKCHYGFIMYDLDEDGYIGSYDLKHVIRRWLTVKEFSDARLQLMVKAIMAQADMEEDGHLSYFEFEHIAGFDMNFEFLFRLQV